MKPAFVRIAVALAGLALSVPTEAFAGPAPPLINQEGLLLRDGFPIDGESIDLTFRLCEAPDGDRCAWTETHDGVEIHSGYYNVILGSLTELTTGVIDTDEIYLEIQVDNDPPLRPRQRMVSTPFAVRATVADNVDGDITPNSVVTGGRIEADSGSITNNFTVSGSLRAQGAASVGGNLTVGGVIQGDLADGTVETADIENRAVTSEKLALGAVLSANIQDGTITSADIRDGGVSSDDLDQSVWDAFGDASDREAGGGGAGGLVIDADSVGGLPASAFLRSDDSDIASGPLYTFRGRISASQGDDGNHGISFQGAGGDQARIEYDANQPDSMLRIGNYGAGNDGVVLSGATIALDADVTSVAGSAEVDMDVAVGGNLSAVGSLFVGGSGSVNGPLIVGGTLSAHDDVDVMGAVAVGSRLTVTLDAVIGRSLTVRGTSQLVGRVVAQGPVIVDGGPGVVTDLTVRHGNVVTENGGDVRADGDVQGENLLARGYIRPSTGRGQHGVTFPSAVFDGSDRAWLYHYQANNGTAGILELGVGNDTDDLLLLKSGGGTQIRSSRTANGLGEAGADLDVGRNLLVRGSSDFQQSINVAGNVTANTLIATRIIAENFDLGDNLTLGTLTVLNSLTVSDGAGGGILRADQISGRLANGIVTSAALANFAVNANKIAGGVIHGGHISDGTIGNVDLGANVVDSSKILNGSVTGSDLANGSVTGSKIADRQINSLHIIDGQVGRADLASNAVLSRHILNGQVSEADLAVGAVTGAKLGANSISTGHIVNGQVTNVDLAGAAVTGSKIAGRTILGGNIAQNAVTNYEIASRTIFGGNIAQNAVTNYEIASRTIVGGNVAQNAIGSYEIANNSITSADIADNTITSADVQNNSLTGSDIANNSITGSDIASNTLTASDIAANAIGNSELGSNSVHSYNISDGQVTSADIANNTVTSSDIRDGTIQYYDIASRTIRGDQIKLATITKAHLNFEIAPPAPPPPAGVKITSAGEAYGHHGWCDRWNGCGSAANCALWACEIKGYRSGVLKHDGGKPCRQYRVCHLFYNRGNIHWNWGNWCNVKGVSEIWCNR